MDSYTRVLYRKLGKTRVRVDIMYTKMERPHLYLLDRVRRVFMSCCGLCALLIEKNFNTLRMT